MALTYSELPLDSVKEIVAQIGQHKSASEILKNLDSMYTLPTE